MSILWRRKQQATLPNAISLALLDFFLFALHKPSTLQREALAPTALGGESTVAKDI